MTTRIAASEIRLLPERIHTSAGQPAGSSPTNVIGVPIHSASATAVPWSPSGNHPHWSQTRNGSAIRVAASSTNESTVQLKIVPK